MSFAQQILPSGCCRWGDACVIIVQQVQHSIQDSIQGVVAGRSDGLRSIGLANRSPIQAADPRVVIVPPHLVPDLIEHPLVQPGTRPVGSGVRHDGDARHRGGDSVGPNGTTCQHPKHSYRRDDAATQRFVLEFWPIVPGGGKHTQP